MFQITINLYNPKCFRCRTKLRWIMESRNISYSLLSMIDDSHPRKVTNRIATWHREKQGITQILSPRNEWVLLHADILRVEKISLNDPINVLAYVFVKLSALPPRQFYRMRVRNAGDGKGWPQKNSGREVTFFFPPASN